LRDVLNTACNITSAVVKGWMGGLTLPVDIADIVVCPAGQKVATVALNHTMSRADVLWNRIRPQVTPLMPPQWPHRV